MELKPEHRFADALLEILMGWLGLFPLLPLTMRALGHTSEAEQVEAGGVGGRKESEATLSF
jgi:hypothetical protein